MKQPTARFADTGNHAPLPLEFLEGAFWDRVMSKIRGRAPSVLLPTFGGFFARRLFDREEHFVRLHKNRFIGHCLVEGI